MNSQKKIYKELMKKKINLLFAIIILFIGCNQSNEKESYIAMTSDFLKEDAMKNNLPKDDGYELMKINCYVCHNPNTKSHDEILAPPFKAVKMHYKKVHDSKENFVDAIVNYVQNPDEEKALMRGAVKRFKVMPKLEISTENLEKIAAYIYDNDVEEPEWMGDHMKEMKGKKKHGNHKKNK